MWNSGSATEVEVDRPTFAAAHLTPNGHAQGLTAALPKKFMASPAGAGDV